MATCSWRLHRVEHDIRVIEALLVIYAKECGSEKVRSVVENEVGEASTFAGSRKASPMTGIGSGRVGSERGLKDAPHTINVEGVDPWSG